MHKTTTQGLLCAALMLIPCTAIAQDIQEHEHNRVANLGKKVSPEFKPEILKRSDRFTGMVTTYLVGNTLPRSDIESSYVVVGVNAQQIKAKASSSTLLDIAGFGLGSGMSNVDLLIDGARFPGVKGSSAVTSPNARRILLSVDAKIIKALRGAKDVQMRFQKDSTMVVVALSPENIAALAAFFDVTSGKPIPAKYKR